MACDPNALLEQAKCLNACIPQQMLQAVEVSLLCQIVDAGGGGGGGGVESFNARTGAVTLELGDVSAVADARYVLKSGDTMTGLLTIEVATTDPVLLLNSIGANRAEYTNGTFLVVDSSGTNLIVLDGPNTSVGFFDGGPVVKQASGANITNNVTAGGTDDTIADFTSLSVYATDAAAIRNDIYQLARKLKQINDGLRAYGLFT